MIIRWTSGDITQYMYKIANQLHLACPSNMTCPVHDTSQFYVSNVSFINSLWMSGRIFAMPQWPYRVDRWYRLHPAAGCPMSTQAVGSEGSGASVCVGTFLFSYSLLQQYQPTPASNNSPRLWKIFFMNR